MNQPPPKFHLFLACLQSQAASHAEKQRFSAFFQHCTRFWPVCKNDSPLARKYEESQDFARSAGRDLIPIRRYVARPPSQKISLSSALRPGDQQGEGHEVGLQENDHADNARQED